MTVKEMIFELAQSFDPDDTVMVGVNISVPVPAGAAWAYGPAQDMWTDDNGHCCVGCSSDGAVQVEEP
jgi:hypothetical protein